VRFDTYDQEIFMMMNSLRLGSTSLRSPVNRKNQFLISRGTPTAKQAARIALFKLGVTFNVYGDDQGQNESCPLIIPRCFSSRMGSARTGSQAAYSCHKSVFGRHLQRAENYQRRRYPCGTYLLCQWVLQALHGSAATRWNLVPY